jgi:uncharacterized protein YciI
LKGASVFVVNLTYIKPLADVDAHLEEHMRFLKTQFERGVFIASGRKVPRDGGVILARCDSRDVLWKVLEQDPFYRTGIARFDVIEFVASTVQQGFENLEGV